MNSNYRSEDNTNYCENAEKPLRSNVFMKHVINFQLAG